MKNQYFWLLLLLIPIAILILCLACRKASKQKSSQIYITGIMPSINGKVKILLDSPRIGTIDNFLTIKECNEIVNTMNLMKDKHEISILTRGGKYILDDSHRLSKSLRVDKESPLFKNILQRVSKKFSLPFSHFENPHIIFYEKGGFFKRHLDHHSYKLPRMRVISMFIYLNDDFEGGETYFDQFDLSVKPKAGRALWWFNVDPKTRKIDNRTYHEGREVTAGKKYGMNVWICNIPFGSQSAKSS